MENTYGNFRVAEGVGVVLPEDEAVRLQKRFL
jgi:hypothetical protein